ncbi:SGNH/GDSL hydrolase family protein [Spirillospora sp. NPDC049024]
MYQRYVAVGDSQTEGLNDGSEATGYRGWADRLAWMLAAHNPDLRYANLAVRGRLAAQIQSEQTRPALDLKPDLVTVMAGMNDLIRPGADVGRVAAALTEMIETFTDSGATVVAFTFPDVAKIVPLARLARGRVLDFNDRIRHAARRQDAVLVDTFCHPVCTDPRLWSPDRIHATPLGHARIAAATAHALDLPGTDASWATPLPPLPTPPPWQRAATEARWIATFVGPWILRRLQGRSSGDGRTAKRPHLAAMGDPPR